MPPSATEVVLLRKNEVKMRFQRQAQAIVKPYFLKNTLVFTLLKM
jgi:hypoxanthine-guanine phosphoribosyltransferase